MQSVPLLTSVGPAPVPVGPDVHVAEYEHVQAAEDGSDAERLRGMAVLVSLSDDPADRLALRPVRDALAFARCAVIGGVEWPQRLAERVAAPPRACEKCGGTAQLRRLHGYLTTLCVTHLAELIAEGSHGSS